MPSQGGGQGSPEGGTTSGSSGNHVFESELRTEPQIKQYIPPHSPLLPMDEEDMQDSEVAVQQVGADGSVTWVRKVVLSSLAPKHASGSQNTPSSYNRPFLLDQGMIVTTPHIDPWTHPAFAPLPEVIIQTLRSVNAIEMPSRHAFDEALIRFVGGLSTELRETATFILDAYADIAHAVSEGLISELSPRLQMWATCHHARSGSRKHHLILLPRDAYYNMNRADEEKFRANYVVLTDGEGELTSTDQFLENNLTPLEATAVFERVPVQSQIYDILVYTHRNHGSSSTMLFEARRIGIVSTLFG